ncbi:hypothetical protein L1987_50251 [Smallanthus sonchifolius]|uniref:Uncharacterized protein n=1 Tax=Smallanthus sonchifolius TaxID=185202 RepID=A0ACB9EN51_9ASTR|nr:hypothetical protein L1987_50251 [Smallanthus sonchifolius]
MFMAQIPSPDDEIGLPITCDVPFCFMDYVDCLHNSVIAVNGYRSAMAYESDHYRKFEVSVNKLVSYNGRWTVAPKWVVNVMYKKHSGQVLRRFSEEDLLEFMSCLKTA